MKKKKSSRQYPLRDKPEVLSILLKDQTTKKNIKWGTADYIDFGFDLKPETEIDIRWLTNGLRDIVQPRVKKDLEIQKERTREKAEVFTPTRIVEKQVEYVEENFKNLVLEEYINITWLEITCGEAPYICTRYDSTTGEPLAIKNRVGFLDKKLRRISKEINKKDKWLKYAKVAYESTYGYEFQGDSLLIARENLFYTFIDYYFEKFQEYPDINSLKYIARTISFNVIQMNGLDYTIPYSVHEKLKEQEVQLSLFKTVEEIKDKSKTLINKNAKIGKKLLSFKDIKKEGNFMKFDVVIGNPPYQEQASGTSTSDDPIYHKFMDSSYSISDIACLITPGRFLFNAGKTPKSWNRQILNNENFKVIHYEPNSSNIFSNTDIKGGIVISYFNKNKRFDPIKTFIPNANLRSIKEKVVNSSGFEPLNKIIETQTKFDLDNLYDDFPEYKKKIGSKGRDKRLRQYVLDRFDDLFKDVGNENDFKILGLVNKKRKYRYIDKKYIETNNYLNNYKVFVTSANGTGKLGERLSSPLVGKPDEGITQTFISIGSFTDEIEADNLLKYLKSKFLRILLGTLKITQGNNKATWLNVPMQNFESNSDIDWDTSISNIDQQLYKKYNLSEEEIKFIEETAEEMK